MVKSGPETRFASSCLRSRTELSCRFSSGCCRRREEALGHVRLVDPYPHEKALAGTAVLDPERRLGHGSKGVGVLLSPCVEATGGAGRLERRHEQRPLPDLYELSGHGGSLAGGYD